MLRSLLLLLLAPAVAAQTTYYVDAAATPPGLGTQAEPWPLIQTALDHPGLLPGDTVLVAPGLYVENLESPVDRITIASTGGPDQTEIRSATASTTFSYGQFPHIFNGPSYLEGFTVTGADAGATSPSGVYVDDPGLTIRGCVLRGNGRGVFNFEEAVIEGCTISGNGHGTGVQSGAHTEVRDCIVWGNNFKDLVVAGLYTTNTVLNCLFPWSTSAIQIGLGQVQGNVHRDPYFWDQEGNDFHLTPRSYAIGESSTGGDIGAFPFDDTYAPATPRPFCRAKIDSAGCEPAIASSGMPSAAGAPFTVSCSQILNNSLGFLYYGHRTQYVPFKGGWQCVAGPTKRTPLVSSGGSSTGSDCSGSFAIDFDALIAAGNNPKLVAGAPVFAQFWYRDLDDPTGYGDGRSDGLGFTVLP